MTKRLSYANRAVVFIMRLLGILLALALAAVLAFFFRNAGHGDQCFAAGGVGRAGAGYFP